MAAPFTPGPGPVRRAGGDGLVQWAERTGRRLDVREIVKLEDDALVAVGYAVDER